MIYEDSLTIDEIEHALIEWAETEEEHATWPPRLRIWRFDEDQLETIKEACVLPYAAATLANAMGCIIEEAGIASIAEILRDY